MVPHDRRLSSNRVRRATRTVLGAFFVLLSTVGVTRSTVFIPLSVEDLARSSTAVLIGTVERLWPTEHPNGGIFTLVEIRVDEVLKGVVDSRTVTLREPGGQLADRTEVIFGAPAYEIGEEVVVFVDVARDGSWRTQHLALGKFRIERDDVGGALARQELGRGASVLEGPGTPEWRDVIPLAELVELILRTVPPTDRTDAFASSIYAHDIAVSAPATTPSFTLQGSPPGRFFEVDEQMEISYLIDSSGDAILGLSAARQAVVDGFDAWNSVSTANITLVDGGLTNNTEAPCIEGMHKVRFNDPDDDIPDPTRAGSNGSNCGGTLAMGGFCTLTPGDEKRFNGRTFARAIRGDVRFADGWEGCSAWTPCNLAEVAAHEVGHSIGLGHSSENRNESDPRLNDAAMFFLAHFDGRCAALRDDDIAGVSFVYPTDPLVTITTDSSQESAANVQTHIPLTAVGGTGAYQWSDVTDHEQCPDAGLSVTPEGFIEGTHNFTDGSTCLLAMATDGNGDFHKKRFDIELVEVASTPTPTTEPATPTRTQTRTPTLTRTPTATFSPVAECIGDCDGDGSVRIDELVLALDMALGLQPFEACNGLDADGDEQVSIDEVVRAVLSAVAGCA